MARGKRRNKKRTTTESKMKAIATRVVKGQIETKTYSLTYAAAGVDFDGTISDLSGLSLGTANINRIGAEIRMQRLHLKFYTIPGSAHEGYSFRFIIFKWLVDDNIQAPIPSYILTSNSTTEAPQSTYNQDRRDDFTIVYDSGVIIPGNIPNGSLCRNVTKSLKNYKIQYNLGNVTTGKNKLYSLTISDRDSSGGTHEPIMSAAMRLWFKDA